MFNQMMNAGCERSVITYSSLISACEKVGQWRTAISFFEYMENEKCRPNTVTFNSLITACAQGVCLRLRQPQDLWCYMVEILC